MRKSFEKVINNYNNEEKKLLFGEGCEIIINNIKYSTNTKKFVLDCKLLVSDVNLLEGSFPDGVVYLALESWKLMGFNQELDVISTVDLVD